MKAILLLAALAALLALAVAGPTVTYQDVCSKQTASAPRTSQERAYLEAAEKELNELYPKLARGRSNFLMTTGQRALCNLTVNDIPLSTHFSRRSEVAADPLLVRHRYVKEAYLGVRNPEVKEYQEVPIGPATLDELIARTNDVDEDTAALLSRSTHYGMAVRSAYEDDDGQLKAHFLLTVVRIGEGKTEYWISQAKYYCKFCKCWMTDKKLTREAHEKGARHKQAVREHFDNLKKTKIAQEREDSEVLAELQKIQKVANQQYAADVSRGHAAYTSGEPESRQPQYFYYGSNDEAFISAQSEEKARLTSFYQQHVAPAAETEASTAAQEGEIDPELQALIERKKEEKRKREEEAEKRGETEEAQPQEERNTRAGPYGAWVTVDKSEIEKREEDQRALKKQRTREIEQDSSESDAEEEDDRVVKQEEEDEPVVAVEFKKRQPAGGRRRPPLRKKLSDD